MDEVISKESLEHDGRVLSLVKRDWPSGYKYAVLVRKLYNFSPGVDEMHQFKDIFEATALYRSISHVDRARFKAAEEAKAGTAVAENPLDNKTILVALRIVNHLIHGTGTAGPGYAPTLKQLYSYVGYKEITLSTFETQFTNLTNHPDSKFPIFIPGEFSGDK